MSKMNSLCWWNGTFPNHWHNPSLRLIDNFLEHTPIKMSKIYVILGHKISVKYSKIFVSTIFEMNKIIFNFEPGEESRGDSYSVKYDVELFPENSQKCVIIKQLYTQNKSLFTISHIMILNYITQPCLIISKPDSESEIITLKFWSTIAWVL